MRLLDPIELRILGSLLEKQQATPEYYPLTLNALVAACNQKTNREPVMELTEAEVLSALERLQNDQLVWKIHGGRAVRWDHRLDARWDLDAPSKAVMTLLLLRGEQTPGEIRGRSERLHEFESVEVAERTLASLASREHPLVTELPRRPGQKESRWRQVVGVQPESAAAAFAERETGDPLLARIERLEANLAAIAHELRELKERLGEV